MNYFLNECKKIWSELGLNQKISIVLVFLVIMGGATAIIMWSAKPSMQLLYGRLDSKDMSEVVSNLEQLNIPYTIEAGGTAIFVPKEKVYSARMHLASKGVPAGGGVGFEIFDQNNFGVSDFVQKTNYNRAIQGELSRTIMQLKGVRSARVMIVTPENRLLAEANGVMPTASVFVDTGSMRLGEDAVNSIRFLVANSVQGLKADDVAIVDNQGNMLSENLKSDKTLGIASSQMRYRQTLEDYYAKKIETMLSKVVGIGNVVARVAVEIESDMAKVFEEKFDPESQVIRTQNIVEDVSVNKESSSAPSQAGGGQGAKEGPGNTSSTEESKKNKNISYEINRSTLEIVKSPGALKRVSAAVFISKNKVMEGGKMVEKSRTNEELVIIKTMIANALGINEEAQSQVSLHEVMFEIPEEPKKTFLENTENVMSSWIGIGKNVGAVVIGLVMFFVLLKMLKKYKPQMSSVDVVDGGIMLGSRNVTPKITPDLLNELIKQKPENVGTALKSWVSKSEEQ